MLEEKISTPSQQNWIAKLLGYDLTIVYKKGKESLAVDALSRVAKLYAMSVVTGQLLQQIQDSYATDVKLSQLIQQLQADPNAKLGYSYLNGVLYKGERVVVGTDKALREQLLQLYHDSAMGGHGGMIVILHRIRRIYH